MHLLTPLTHLSLLLLTTTTQAAVSIPLQSACSIKHPLGYTGPSETNSLRSGNATRYYGIQVPADYKPTTSSTSAKRYPLILDFHGRHGDPDGQRDNSKYYVSQAGRGYVVVYPLGCEGRGGETAWQGANYANKSCDDLLFVKDLVASIQGSYCIDPSRIYASGKSNGGGFVDTIACSAVGDLFAGFAMAGAALYTDNSYGNCSRVRAVMEAHGTADNVININGNVSSNGGPVPNIAEWTSWWGRRDGCDPVKDMKLTKVPAWGNLTTYSCGKKVEVVKQYRVAGGGHCWPTKGTNTDSDLKNCDIQTLNYTAEVLGFFAKWKLGDLTK